MAINLKGPDTGKMVQVLLVAVVMLFFITQIINFSALNNDDVDVFRDNVDYGQVASQTFTWLIAGMAVWLAWSLTMGFQGRMDKKKLLSMVIILVALYFIYNKVLVGVIPDLQPIEFAAYQMQTMFVP